MAISGRFARSVSIAVVLAASGACSSSERTDPPPPVAGHAGASEPADNPSQAGRTAAVSGGRSAPVSAAGALAAAGSGGAGQAGGSAAGSGGSAGASTGGAAGTTGDAGAGPASLEDELAKFLGLDGAPSCEGLLCFEAADCTTLYPEAAATCKFKDCVDFVCR